MLKPRPALSSEDIRASSRMERVLSGIWSTVLGVEDVGVEDNFFDLGGDWMLSIQVSSLVDKEIGIEVPSGLLFEFPTIRKLAEFLQERKSEADRQPPALQEAAGGVEVAAARSVIDKLVSDIRRKLSED